MQSRDFSGFYVCPLAAASVSIRRLLSKYHTPVQLDQQDSTTFVDSFTNPTCESSEVNRFKLELSLADKHYVNNSGFHG